MTVTPADTSLTVHMPEAEVAGLAEGNPTGVIIAGIFAPVVAGVIIASPVDEATAGKYILDELIEEIDPEDFLDEEDDPPLIPDGGTEDRPPGFYALRKQGVPEATIEQWERKGYDLQRMSNALATYKKSGQSLSSNWGNAKGDLGEIVAKPKIKSMYPASQGYEYTQGVKLKRDSYPPDITELDWVVTDSETGDVVAVYQVKGRLGKANAAQSQLQRSKAAFKAGDVDHLAEAQSLHKDNFTDNINNIDRFTVGPKDDPSYDRRFSLTNDELETLLDAIRRGKV